MPDPLTEGFVSLLEGVDGGIDASLLSTTKFASGVNLSIRGGLIGTRPVFKKLADLGEGKFQGASIYRLNSGERVVFSIDGVVSSYNLSTGLATAFAETMDATANFAYFAQSDRFFIVQDNINRPLFLNGDALLRRADPYQVFDPDDLTTKNDVFTGSLMAYGHGRTIVVAKHLHGIDGIPDPTTEGRPYFVAGDILKPNDPEEVLKFSETNYLAGGGAASMPSEFGFIQGLIFFRNSPSGSGQGPLVIFARTGVSAFTVQSPRSNWQSLDFSQVLFSGVGTLSPRSVIPVNDDILFQAEDGVRSLRYTTSQIAGSSGSLSITPLSNEISHRLPLNSFEDLPFISYSFAANRLLGTLSGNAAGQFQGLFCLDTAAAFSVTSATPPAYNDIWTGLNFQQTLSAGVNNKPTHLFISKNGDQNELWYVDEDGYFDGDDSRPLCRVCTRKYSFDTPQFMKAFMYADVWVRDLRGDVRMKMYWRPDGYELWNETNEVNLSAPVNVSGALPQRRFQLRFSPEKEFLCDETTGDNILVGSTFQFCVEWEGFLKIEKAAFYVRPEITEPKLQCEDETGVVALVEGSGGVLLDDFTYSIV